MSDLNGVVAQLKSRVHDLEQTVARIDKHMKLVEEGAGKAFTEADKAFDQLRDSIARLEERDAQLQQSMNDNLVQHNNRIRALEHDSVYVPEKPVVEPTGYEEWDSEQLLSDYYNGYEIEGEDPIITQRKRMREILIRMQQGSD